MVRISRLKYPRHSWIALTVMIGFVLALVVAELTLHPISSMSEVPATEIDTVAHLVDIPVINR